MILLLVTWLNAGGQPQLSYVAEFSSMATCQAARAALYREEARLATVSVAGAGPRLSAVCAPK